MRFEDLEVWKESMRLTVDTYRALQECNDYSLRDQMQRSVVSIPSNIAEGFELQTNKEFIRYLHIARGSAAELRTQLYITMKTELLPSDTANDLITRTKSISAMLTALIKTRQNFKDK